MKWRLYICSDCDEDDGVLVHRVPDSASSERGCNVEHCPGCGSYLSLLDMGEVEVSGRSLVHLRMRTPAEVD
jgi:hypothetical protein